MRRREFIVFVGGATVAWPLTARAQQPSMPLVGFLRSSSFADATHLVTAFRQGLKESGSRAGMSRSNTALWKIFLRWTEVLSCIQ
jgi:hypothetical protein